MLPTLKLISNEMIDHEEGFTTMRLHCELPNGAHFFVDEDDWYVGFGGQEVIKFAELINSKLEKFNANVRVALIENEQGANVFTLIDVVELAADEHNIELMETPDFLDGVTFLDEMWPTVGTYSRAEQYAREQVIDAQTSGEENSDVE